MGWFGLNKKENTPKKNNASFDTFGRTKELTYGVQNYTKTSRGYLFGDNGLYPQELNELYNSSPLQNDIINFKSLLTSGNGYEINGLVQDGMSKVNLNQLLTQFDKAIPQITSDYFLQNRFTLKITWNNDNTKILKVVALPADTIRVASLDTEMNPLTFLYNFDWTQPSKFNTVKYSTFDQQDIENKEQIYMFQKVSPGKKIYTYPSYQSSVKWITLDAEMATFHTSNIENSLNPSILMQYFQEPETKEQKSEILYDLNQSFAGAKKTGRAMVTFADGKENSPEVTQMEANKLDSTFLSLTDTIQRQICYSHSIDPMLLGLKTPGSLGNSGEFEYAYDLFNQMSIQPSQLDLENVFNEILGINQMTVKLKFNDAEITKPTYSDNQVVINNTK